MFGKMVRATRQGWAILSVMFLLMITGVVIAAPAEQHGSPVLRDSGVNLTASSNSPGGNMEGKEIRVRDRQHRPLGDRRPPTPRTAR